MRGLASEGAIASRIPGRSLHAEERLQSFSVAPRESCSLPHGYLPGPGSGATLEIDEGGGGADSPGPPEWERPIGPCLLVASSGGHLLQLVQLADVWGREDRAWVTFKKPDALSLLEGEHTIFAHHPTNRNAFNLVLNSLLAIRVFLRLRPKVVLSTGAGVGVPFCWVGRAFGARVIFVESFSRITEPSLAGRLVHPVAHRFFVQWPEMLERYRKAEYRGPVF